MPLQDIQKQFLKRCAESPAFFISQLAYIQHPTFGKMRFNLFDYQVKAIRDFLKYRFNIFHKVRQCFVEGTPVWTPNGPTPIEKLRPGDLVYTFDTMLNQITQKPITKVIDNGLSKNLVEVRSKTGHRVRCTSDHRYYIDHNWVEACNITENDTLTEIYDAPRYGKPIHPSDPILLGYLLTDGCCREGSFYFCNTRFRYILDYQKHLTRRVGHRVKVKKQKFGNRQKLEAYRVYGYGTDCKLLDDYGLRNKKKGDKVIPEQVFQWSNEHIAKLLNRMYAGDGWYSGRNNDESKRGCGNEIGICSESLLVLQQIRMLLSRFHISANIYIGNGKKGSINKLRIMDAANVNKFVEHIGIFGKELRKEQTRGFHFNRKLGAVKSVKPITEEARIYDLEVPPHHNFIVDGAVVHNSGVSTLCGAFALWRGMFFKNKTILVVSKTDETAMEFLRRNVKYVYENLPNWMKDLWPIEQNEHRIVFHNGSRITSLTSAPNTLRSNSSTLNIIDEAAFMPKMEEMWAGGWPCARGDTLVQTADGLIKIQDLAFGGDPWKDLNIEVATDEGMQQSNKAYVSGKHPTRKIVTRLGYEFEGTLHHRLRVIDENGEYVWKKLEDIEPGELIVTMPGQFIGKRRYLIDGTELSVELAEILGLYVGDGSLSIERPKRFKIVFDPQDEATRDRIVTQFNNLKLPIKSEAYCETEYDTENLRLNSAEFIDIMTMNKLNSKTKPQDAEIPALILQSDQAVLCGFLRGLFDSDGWCYQSSTCLKLGFSTTSEKLAEQVQTALHSLGIISKRYQIDPAMVPDRNDMRYSDKPYYRVDIWDAASKQKYKELIGFITKRKQDALNSYASSNEHTTVRHHVLVREFAKAALQKILAGTSFKKCKDSRKWNLMRIVRTGRVKASLVKEMQCDDRLSRLIEKGFFFDEVSVIFNGDCETFDISVPENNTYLANGMVSHNTLQTGGNVIVISCVPKGTYVFTDKGICDIGELVNEVEPIGRGYVIPEYKVLGKDKLRAGAIMYNNGKHKTKIISTRYGEVEGTLSHKLWACKEGKYGWYKMEQLNKGDWLTIQYGMNVWGKDDDISDFEPSKNVKHYWKPNKLTEDIAYVIGLYLSEGCIYYFGGNSYRTTITCGDDISDSITKAGLRFTCTDGIHYQIFTSNFAELLMHLGIDIKAKAPHKAISNRLLKCSKNVVKALIQGIFDGDGWARGRGGVGYTTTSSKLVKQLRIILNNFGILTTRSIVTAAEANERIARVKNNARKVKKHNYDTFRIEIAPAFAKKYFDDVGFRLKRKQGLYAIVKEKIRGTSWDVIPYSRGLCHAMFNALPFGTYKLDRQYGLNLNVMLSNKKIHKSEHVSRLTVNRLYEVAKEYINLDMELEKRRANQTSIWVKITDISESEQDTYDFSLPDDVDDPWAHSVVYDGFLGHQTPNGIGNWYWRNVKDAIEGNNDFHLIKINWWDMTYKLEGYDPAMKRKVIIDPTAGLTDCVTKEDKTRFGLKKSPWLEEQYRGMASRGEDRLFRQEYLCEFLGTGNTVLSREQLEQIELTVSEDFKTVGTENYVNPSTQERARLEFDDKLWIWEKPIKGHIYVAGVDTSSGEAHDYSGVVVWDITTKAQVAELRIRTRPKTLALMVDYIGRVYNNAMVVVERNNIGITVVQALWQDLSYPSIFREVRQNKKLKKSMGLLGFTTGTKSKGELNAALQNNIGDGGFEIRSRRLKNEADIYVYHSRNQTGAEDGPGNTDDLIIAAALGLIGRDQATRLSGFLPPPVHDMVAPNLRDKKKNWDEAHKDIVDRYATKGTKVAVPLVINSESITGRQNSFGELGVFMAQMQAKKPDNTNQLPVVVDKTKDLKKK